MTGESEERTGAGDDRRARLAARRARRLRESGALLLVVLGLFFVMASIGRALPSDGSQGLTDSPGKLAEGVLGIAMALGAVVLAARAWRRWVPAWVLCAAGLLVAHWVLFAYVLSS